MSEGPGGPQGATAGGTLAMRMLSQQAMVASQMKRAANDKAIAQMLASKKSGPPAARLGDEIQHKSFLGALAGAVLGAIVTIAEGCLIMAACATGPYALVLVPALMYASYKASDYVEEKQNQLESWINSFCDTDGAINTGSENVKINGELAARAAVTLPPPPPPGAIPEVPQGEPSWGDIATDLLESAAEKAVPLAKAWGNADHPDGQQCRFYGSRQRRRIASVSRRSGINGVCHHGGRAWRNQKRGGFPGSR